MRRCRLQPAQLLTQVAHLVRQLEHPPAEGVLLRQVLGNGRLGRVSGRIGLQAQTQRCSGRVGGVKKPRGAGRGTPNLEPAAI